METGWGLESSSNAKLYLVKGIYCAKHRECLFGKVHDDILIKNEYILNNVLYKGYSSFSFLECFGSEATIRMLRLVKI